MNPDQSAPKSNYASISPRPRIRPVALPPLEVKAAGKDASLAASATPAMGDAQEQVPPVPKRGGYKNPPVDKQFKKGNKGGPGRPKGSKSHDTLLRAELNAKQTVRSGGRERQVSKRELAATLLINTALEKRDHRMLTALNAEARRLYPEAVADAGAQEAYDPALDRQILQQLLQQLALGEPNPENSDPLRDLAIGDPDLGQADENDSWSEGDWDAVDDGGASDENR